MFVRPAYPADIPTMVSLLALLFAQEADFPPNEKDSLQALGQVLQTPSVGRQRRAAGLEPARAKVEGNVMWPKHA